MNEVHLIRKCVHEQFKFLFATISEASVIQYS